MKYYKKMSKNVIICYAISIIAFAAVFALSYAVLRNIDPLAVGTGNVFLMIASFVVTGIASYLSCRRMRNAVISSEDNGASESLPTLLKFAASLPFLLSLVNFAISLLGGVVVAFIVDSFTELRYDNFALFCSVVKIPLFIGFAVFLASIGHYNGFSDAKTRSFNPHLVLIALILSFTFMMPMTVSDHMYDNAEIRGSVSYSNPTGSMGARSTGKIIYNVQGAFGSNIDLYKDNYQLIVNDEFSGIRVVSSILLSTVIQISIAMFAYRIWQTLKKKSIGEEKKVCK